LPETRVAYMRHVGPYGDPGIARLWQRFEAWCRQRGLLDRHHAVYGVSRDSPDITAPDKCRYDACVEVDDAFVPEGDVGVQSVPGGLYACTPFSGTPDRIHAAWVRLCAEWLPDSDCQADDRPEVEAYGDELKVDKTTGAFSCLLCLPVRAQ
jgi:AraC family transcriptional regulator